MQFSPFVLLFDVDKPSPSPTTYCILKVIVLMLSAHFWHTSSGQIFVFINDLAICFDFQVILIQEQLSKNRIIIDTDNKGRYYVYYFEFIPVSSKFFVLLGFDNCWNGISFVNQLSSWLFP